jgi:hypothetical protein
LADSPVEGSGFELPVPRHNKLPPSRYRKFARLSAGGREIRTRQIAQLSSRITLYPGDVTLTGAPAGVSAGRGEFLKPGDVVKLWIEKIGSLTNTMI